MSSERTGGAGQTGGSVAARSTSQQMRELALTDRQLRERAYYDEYVKRTKPSVASQDIIRGARRPWNPYWSVAELLLGHAATPGLRLLDFGCGPGTYAVLFAQMGYDVTGVDVSPANVTAAQRLAARHGVEDRSRFEVGVAEHLQYPPAHFDMVVGVDILHHVEVRPAFTECLRVLKPGGIAVFKEPIEVPLFDQLRRTELGRALRPTDPSFERHVTSDERKLTAGDLRLIKSLCVAQERRFRILSRAEGLVPAPWCTKNGSSYLELVDYYLQRALPCVARFGGTVLLVCRHRAGQAPVS